MASDRVMFLSWDRPVPGREMAGMETFGQFTNWLGKQQTAGRIESFEPVLLDPHGEHLNGFVLVRGNYNNIAQIQNDEDYLNLMTRGTYEMQGLAVYNGSVGTAFQQRMTRWQKVIRK